MGDDLLKLYELMLRQHSEAVDLRVRIVSGLCWLYVTLTAAFGWFYIQGQNGQGQAPLRFLFLVPSVASIVTWFLWMADLRNRTGIRAPRTVGEAIERDFEKDGVGGGEFYFRNLSDDLTSHGEIIDWLSRGFMIFFALATAGCLLLFTFGLSCVSEYPFCDALCLLAVAFAVGIQVGLLSLAWNQSKKV